MEIDHDELQRAELPAGVDHCVDRSRGSILARGLVHSLSIRPSTYSAFVLTHRPLVTRHRYWLMTLNVVWHARCGRAPSSQRRRAGAAKTEELITAAELPSTTAAYACHGKPLGISIPTRSWRPVLVEYRAR